MSGQPSSVTRHRESCALPTGSRTTMARSRAAARGRARTSPTSRRRHLASRDVEVAVVVDVGHVHARDVVDRRAACRRQRSGRSEASELVVEQQRDRGRARGDRHREIRPLVAVQVARRELVGLRAGDGEVDARRERTRAVVVEHRHVGFVPVPVRGREVLVAVAVGVEGDDARRPSAADVVLHRREGRVAVVQEHADGMAGRPVAARAEGQIDVAIAVEVRGRDAAVSVVIGVESATNSGG